MDQASTLRNIANNPSFTKVLAITSGKGGVGKTNIISNIAFMLSKHGKKVLLLDADLGLGNVDILLGLAPKYNISHVLKGEKNLSDILVDGPGNIKIIPASSGIQKVTDLSENEKINLMNELDNLNLDYDYFLIDTGAGISKNVTYFCIAAQEVIVIATPEPTSITDAYALMKVLFQNYKKKKFNLIVNMVQSSKEAFQVFKTLTLVIDKYLGMELSLNYLGHIPADTNFPASVRKQKLFTELFPGTDTYNAINKIAKKIDEMEIDTNLQGNIQFFWNKILSM